MRVAFLVMFCICLPKVSLRPMVTPRYFALSDQLMEWLSSSSGGTWVVFECPKMIPTVLVAFILIRHR